MDRGYIYLNKKNLIRNLDYLGKTIPEKNMFSCKS